MAETKNTLYIEDGVLTDLEQDIFGHKHIADAVVESILHTDPPFTIGIFGGWGAGKSSLLDIVGTKLSNNNIVTATIDAWRYSSSSNLRRAFLVHVAKELTPGLLDALREELFSSKQVTAPFRPSKVDLSKKNFGRRVLDGIALALRLISKFIGLLAVLFLITFLIFSLLIVLQNSGFRDFWMSFDWADFQDKLFSLAFIPLVLAILDDVRLYFVQQPVTVIQERIDADELFSQYFDKVVEEKTKGVFAKKRLVIFVDNLDRLSNEKMVEALEGLKTYLSNPKCIFVVACDDNVVRSVVNKSEQIPRVDGDNSENVKAGEHYLDKFFQQTFRLPEYMSVNLHDFAMRNFRTTILYNELTIKNVDISYLLSIILPSHVNSPRKVKRLLNEFIALYEIVRRRESDRDGQLRPGQLSTNVEALGKFSTLRAEFPEFYQLLIKDPGLLSRVIDSIQQVSVKPEVQQPQPVSIPNLDRLLSYLRKTESILISEIDTYIWLSQDNLSLGLPSNLVNQLRSNLINNDSAQFATILDEGANVSEKILIIRVASRIAERLAGIEQQNSVKVLAYLLPKIDVSVRIETAHIVATMMTRRLEGFSAREILNVLRWAKRGGIETQRQNLIDQVLKKLDSQEDRIRTFVSILDNADVIQQNNASNRVRSWLAEIFSANRQILKGDDDESKKNLITSSREFAEWVISQAATYSENNLVIDNFYSHELVDYAALRVLGDESLEGIFLEEEGLGQDINSVFNILARRANAGVDDSRYWSGILSIIQGTSYIEDLEFGINHIINSINICPNKLIEIFTVNSFLAIERIAKKSGENKIEDQALVSLFNEVTTLVDRLRGKKAQEFDELLLNKLPDCISEITLIPVLQPKLFEFVEQFAGKYDKWEADLFTLGILLALTKSTDDLDLNKKSINLVIDMDRFVNDENRVKVLSRLDFMVLSNQQDKVDCVASLLKRVVSLDSYRSHMGTIAGTWLENLRADEAIEIFQLRTDIFDLLIARKILASDAYVRKVIGLLPFGGDKNLLLITFNQVDKISESIPSEAGKDLLSAVMSQIGVLGTACPKALNVGSLWVESADHNERLLFDSNILSLYENAPNLDLPVQSVSWLEMTSDQIKNHVVRIFLIPIDDDLKKNRDKATLNAFHAVEPSERSEAVLFIWNQLINDRAASEIFMSVVRRSMSLDNLAKIRLDAISIVRENSDPALSVSNLRLLAATIRDDIDDTDMVVDLFVNLFGRGADDVQMAAKYVVQCLAHIRLDREQKYFFSESMSKAVARTDEEIEIIEQKARELGLRWFRYKGKDKSEK